MVLPLPPEKPEVPGVPLATQLYEAPVTSAESARLNGAPEQRVEARGETVTEGLGYTVTLKFTGPLVHPFSSIFTPYTTVRITFSLLVNVCDITDPEPSLKPVTFPVVVAFQVNVMPGTLPTRLITTLLPEQTVGLLGTTVSTCSGLTFTVTWISAPTHPLKVGVIT
jgi:hypothetical protein